ncbi:Mbeg1-like protein [Legionella sp. km772]|uniref:lipase family protein n=1 Tax=Legionella sp. km772 TaxID=2498111 RepID=UPI000F8CED7B|nr:Mbeg1-like protein [Legionella sp. km772]RUR06515.1 DUF2974 domain-containing protein [Legionella sp. km772]
MGRHRAKRKTRELASSCTIDLISTAAQAPYRVKANNQINPAEKPEYQETFDILKRHGYELTWAIAPKSAKGTGTTELGAVCIEPQDKKAPIIIAFRGTKSTWDLLSDLRLGLFGVVSKSFRDDAFNFYNDVRKKYPDREIILTGHSLGGHIATYVATKAYNTDPRLAYEPLVQVRTFNSAPIETTHHKILNSSSHLLARFVNYRLSSDLVSDLPLKKYVGNTFVFPCEKWNFQSHSMKVIRAHLPAAIFKLEVGASKHGSAEHNSLLEMIHGVLASYQSRVNGQYFSRFRAGAKNLDAMQEVFPEVIKLIEKKEYNQAILKLVDLKEQLNGTVSRAIVDVLMLSTNNVKIQQQMKLAESKDQLRQQQNAMKAQLREAIVDPDFSRDEPLRPK